MAVYSISKIQIRRGKKNSGTGLPQLASGELAWAIDTKELYIGNGSISEGASSVGNTKILTEYDDILSISNKYQYKKNATNFNNKPIFNNLQDILDETVSSLKYGINPDRPEDDQSVAIQNAIDKLFKNRLSNDNIFDSSKRVALRFLPGTYKINNTIKIPSNCTIIGAGINKTIFKFDGNGPVFEFIKDDIISNFNNTSIDSAEVGSGIIPENYTYITQPKYCMFDNFTIVCKTNITCLKLNMVRDSVFQNISIVGPWSFGDPIKSVAIDLTAYSNIITSKNNKFTNINIKGFNTGIYSKYDISNNIFDKLHINQTNIGISFGVGISGNSNTGQGYGPTENTIQNSYFENIEKHAILIENGIRNKSINNHFKNILNTIIKLPYDVSKNHGNYSLNDSFDRDLLQTSFSNIYLPEISGSAHIQQYTTNTVELIKSSSTQQLFRLPITDLTTTTEKRIVPGTAISYIIRDDNNNVKVFGKFEITMIQENNTNVQYNNDYTTTDNSINANNFKLMASVEQNQNNTYNLIISYTNENDNYNIFTYSYNTLA